MASPAGLHPQLAALFGKRPQIIKPGLERIERALACLGPDRLLSVPSVLIGGTNGKGTTTGFLWQLLAGLGVRTGLFTSPHLVRFEERIQASHGLVDEALLRGELTALQQELPPDVYEPLSFFEVNTLLALRVFRRLDVEVDLLEVGLGGRWDSTNIARPRLAVVTSIGMDHQEFLGDTPAKIAFEKAGIMRPKTPVIWGGDGAGTAAAAAVLRREAEAKAAPFLELGRDFGSKGGEAWAVSALSILALPPGGSEGAVVRAPLPAAWQTWPGFLRDNWLKAFAALVQILGDGSLAPVRQRLGILDVGAAVRAAVLAVDRGQVPVPPCMRGRFEQVTARGPDGAPRRLLLDVCHNVDGARALVRGLNEAGLLAGGRLPGVVSILADKDCDGILDVLRSALAPLSLFAVASERTWNQERLAPRHQDLPFHPTFAAAFAAAAPPPPGRPTVVCGSVYAVGEVCRALGIAILPPVHI